ncbi:Holliday junction branch migration protein RuvA [bacterium]|jgi:holliday junction DNA helicase RuvA|nr:Holliday junction branch migration protein RuvA [bacterium]MBT4250889.1 Holliday junction branch migration protein RuvA [bacterium]MBT4597602.1 Holliday junction branch migration protein RuvA [bacterium]MBT6754067.1 Holliday junction branch migration protein RuvA [bacterium]MBT7038097.1 Holliday junction branch migration protein RuvA [bacterium]
MIGKLNGKVDLVHNNFAIIDVCGLGYKVFLTEVSLGRITAREEISLFIHTNVKEDHIHLYGFESLEELEMFELLLSISGVGPKAGLGILTIASPMTIKNAIKKGEPGILTKVSGIGKKTAERIVLELSNKIDNITINDDAEVETDYEVVEALMAMGYSVAEAREANKSIPKELSDISDKIKFALKSMKK